jgi:hypothetical protein
MSLPYALMPVCRQQYRHPITDDPLAGGTLEFYVAGSDTPASVYTTAAGTVALGTTVTLDMCGFAAAVYLAPGGYKVVVKDADGAVVYTQDGVEDVGLTFLDSIGEQWLEGSSAVTSGYQVLTTDRFVTVMSTGGANPCEITLCAADEHPSPLCIKNLGTIPITLIRGNSGDNIESLAQAYTIPAASSPVFPSIWLMADGLADWWIIASHGVV